MRALGRLLAYEADTYREYLEEVALRVGHIVRRQRQGHRPNVLQPACVSTLANELASFQADEAERVKGGVPQGDERGGFIMGRMDRLASDRGSARAQRRTPARSGASARGSGRSKTWRRQSKEP